MLGLLRNHKNRNDELVAKVDAEEKQSIIEQIRANKLLEQGKRVLEWRDKCLGCSLRATLLFLISNVDILVLYDIIQV